MRKRYLYSYQSGGYPQVFPSTPATGITINAAPIVQAASMPIDSGLQGYMGIQQLRQQRERAELEKQQFALQQEQFRNNIEQQKKQDLVNTFNLYSKVKNDIFDLEILPVHGERLGEIIENSKLGEASKSINNDKDGLQRYVNAAQDIFMNSEVADMIRQKKHSDANLKMFSDLDIPIEYIDNYSDVVNSVISGNGVPEMAINHERHQLDIKHARENKELDIEIKRMESLTKRDALVQQMEINEQLAPYREQEIAAKIAKMQADTTETQIDADIKSNQLGLFKSLLEKATSPEEKAALYMRWNSRGSSATAASIDQQYIDALKAEGFSTRQAIEHLHANKSNKATVSSGYLDMKNYKDPLSVGGVTLNPADMKHHFYGEDGKVPNSNISIPWGSGPNIKPLDKGNKVVAYTQDGYFYTNNPHGFISAGITTPKEFRDNIERFGDRLWRIPVADVGGDNSSLPNTSNSQKIGDMGFRNRNPLNIKDPNTETFRTFNSPEEGLHAAISDIRYKMSGKSSALNSYLQKQNKSFDNATVADLISVWAPTHENNTAAYIAHVNEVLPSSTILKDLSDEQLLSLVTQMMKLESPDSYNYFMRKTQDASVDFSAKWKPTKQVGK